MILAEQLYVVLFIEDVRQRWESRSTRQPDPIEPFGLFPNEEEKFILADLAIQASCSFQHVMINHGKGTDD